MRQFLILAVALLLTACSSKPAESTQAPVEVTPASPVAATPAELTTVAFDTEEHSFGTIAEGEKVSYKFTFTNTGDKHLTLIDVKPSCGCTTPEWTKTPVAPGEKGFVKVEFDSKGKPGVNNKSVDVRMNTAEGVKQLRFTAEVAPAQK